MTFAASARDSILIKTRGVNRETLPSALALLQGCWKSGSLLWMQANDFPALSGLIVSGWTQSSNEALSVFCQEKSTSELLVRIEKPGQRWTRRRGGYTIASEEAHSLVEELTSEGLITILLEPASPHMDIFSLTSVCDLRSGKVDVEVVGHGFDASDILRGDITPHERFELSFDDTPLRSGSATRLPMRRTYLVERERYRESVRRRLAKIGARLRNPSFPDDLMGMRGSASLQEELAEEAMRYLRTRGQTALLDHADEYEPIAPGLLNIFLNRLGELFQRMRRRRVQWQVFSVAGSFLSRDRLVIWDFFPAGDHDTDL